MGADECDQAPGEARAHAPHGGVVERTRHLRVGVAQVDGHRAVAKRDREPDAVRIRRDHVVVDEVPELVNPFGHGSEHRPGLLLGIGEQRVLAVREGVGAVARDHALNALGPGLQRRQQRLEVAEVELGRTAVRGKQREPVFVDRAAADNLQRRHPQAFLEDVGVGGRNASRHPAAHVVEMAEAPAVGDDAPGVEIGTHQVIVGKMGGKPVRGVGVVGADHVAGLEIRKRLDHAVQRVIDRGHAGDGGIAGPGEDVAGEVGDADPEVAAFLDEGRTRGAFQRQRHLVGDPRDLAAENLQKGGIDRVHGPPQSSVPAPRVRIRLPIRSTTACHPGRIQVVLSSCSTMAGPPTTASHRSRLRWNTGTSNAAP